MAYSVTHEIGLRTNTTKQDHRKPLLPWLCPRPGLFGQLTAQKSAHTQQAICEAGKKGNGQEHLMRKKDEAGHTHPRSPSHRWTGQDGNKKCTEKAECMENVPKSISRKPLQGTAGEQAT